MRASDSSPKLFQHPWLDYWTRTPYWVIPLLWVPVSVYIFLLGYRKNICTLGMESLIYFLGGIIIWTYSEYTFHRFIFHYSPSSHIGKKIHFYIHGIHHDWPNDEYRLVFPPLFGGTLAAAFAYLFYVILQTKFYAFFPGFLLGYVGYEMIHYSVHHVKWKHPWFMKLKRHHLLHHFSEKYDGKKYGVSSPFWDIIFRTN